MKWNEPGGFWREHMSGATTTADRASKFKVPWDVSEWIDRAALIQKLEQDVDSLNWSNPELIAFLSANPNFHPRFLLVLMSYAYAVGLCESEEISELCHRDELIKSRVAGQAPSPAAITRFRRDHRGLLRWLVAQGFKHALRNHHQLGGAAIPPGLARLLRQAAADRIDVGRHLDRSVQGE